MKQRGKKKKELKEMTDPALRTELVQGPDSKVEAPSQGKELGSGFWRGRRRVREADGC